MKGPGHQKAPSPRESSTWSDRGERPEDRGRGVSKILRSYKCQPTFSGLYDEDLESIAENFAETAESCDATDQEKRREIFSMLHGSTRTLFNRKGKFCVTFEDGMMLLRSWYNSEDKQGRQLTEWHNMSLTKTMEDRPGESQMSLFRSFAARLMSLQHQLQKDYHTDKYLRDRLMSAVEIPDIQNTLRDRTPRTSHQLINRVENLLSTRAGSSGTEANMSLEW